MDKVTLHPDESGYSFKDGIETLRAILDSGMGRYGRGVINAAVAMNVQWTCNPEEFEYMQGVHDTHVAEGYAPFPIDLFLNTAEYVEMQVRMIPGSYGLKSHAGNAYIVGCTLEVQPPNKFTPTSDLGDFTLLPDSASYSFDRMAMAIHTALQGGLGRVRSDLIGASTSVRVQWTVNPVEFVYIRNFYSQWVMNPVPFNMELILDTAAPSTYSVMFMPGSMGLASIVGRGLVITANLEALPILTDPVIPPGGSGPWLFYDDGTEYAPIFKGASSAIDITELTPIPFEIGVECVNDTGLGENEVFSSSPDIPLYSLNELPGPTQYLWTPAGPDAPEDPELPPYPVPSIRTENPNPTEWANATYFVWWNYGGFAVTTSGWAGGTLTLYTGNDPLNGGVTLIHYGAASSMYPPISVEYASLG